MYLLEPSTSASMVLSKPSLENSSMTSSSMWKMRLADCFSRICCSSFELICASRKRAKPTIQEHRREYIYKILC